MAFVKSFVGPPGHLEVGPSTSATTPLGQATTVYGRPYWIDQPRSLDPDGSYESIERALRDLDGRFSLVCVGNTRALLATDSLGCGPCFITSSADGVIVSSHLGSLVRRTTMGRSLDPVGVAAAVGGSVAVGGRTPYSGIHRLVACEYVIIDLAAGQVSRRSTYGSPPEIFGLDHERPGDPGELAHLLRQAIARERDVRALFLTGGSDSRAIASHLDDDRRRKTRALTYGGWRATDRRGAPAVAVELGMRSRLIGPLRLRLADYARPIVTMGAGSSGFDAAPHVAGARAGRSHAPVIFSGYLGDVLAGNGFEPDKDRELARTLSRNLNWVRKCGVDLRSEFSDEIGLLESDLGAMLDDYHDLPPGRASLLLNLMHRQAHYIGGTFDMMQTEVEIATPFFSRPLISYFLTRTPEDLLDKRLYHRTLYESDVAPMATGRGLVSRWSQRVERDRKPYGTVNWNAVLERSKSWMVAQLLAADDGSRLTELARDSLQTRATLPLALTALPIIMTAHR